MSFLQLKCYQRNLALNTCDPQWIQLTVSAHSSAPLILCLSVLSQILIELETALLDDIPHWYKLQTHDVSSIPLPQPSPYLPRRHVHGDSPSKKLQSMSVYIQYMYRLSVFMCVYDLISVVLT